MKSTKVNKGFWRNNGLSLTLATLFIAAWVGQAFTGWRTENNDLAEHERSSITFFEYLHSGHFVEVTMENWESEFLQLFVYVVLTAFLFQKGSAESKDPDTSEEEEPPLTANSPKWARTGGWQRKIYSYSLSLAFLILFLITFLLHAAGGVKQYNEEQLLHGESPVSFAGYMASSQFWFESLQNWQSEFLSLLSMVILSIFLRQKGSPESKPVNEPHSSNPS